MGSIDQKKFKVILKTGLLDDKNKKTNDVPVKSPNNDVECKSGSKSATKIAGLNQTDEQESIQTSMSGKGESLRKADETRHMSDKEIKHMSDNEAKHMGSKSTNSSKNTTNENDQTDIDPNALKELMGFTGFGTTKNKKIASNVRGIVKVTKKKHNSGFRQYMNREKGFNRPLSPPRTSKKK